MVIWAAHIYANKERRLDSTHEIVVPVVPGHGPGHRPGRLGNDLGTALVLFALLLGSLWVVGAPRRFFTVMFSVVAVGLFVLVGTNAERLGRVTTFVDPFNDYHDKGWQPAHGLYALSTRRAVRPGHRRQPAEVGRPARGAHRLHLRGARGGARPGRHPAGDHPVPHHRVRGAARRPAYRRPLRALRLVRHRGLAGRPDDDQRRHGARAAPGDRHPAAADLLRRLRAAPVAGRARPPRRLRAPRAGGGAGAGPAAQAALGGAVRRPSA